MRLRGSRRVATRAGAVLAVALMLAGCAGLPTSGDVQSGLELGAPPEDLYILPLASGPSDDASPVQIVVGFMEAAITPADDWDTARKFLTPDIAAAWKPGAGVSIDEAAVEREVTAETALVADAEDGATVGISVQIDQVASVDAAGEYSEEAGTATLPFVVEMVDGQWRIAQAPDGIVIDASRFARVFNDYALQYFDSTWSRLVPDVRWFPRRDTIATTITQRLIGGVPSPWLAPGVQSAFPADVRLARDAVPITPDQVAEVALNRVAAGLDQETLARMRTQLQQTLIQAGINVSQVKFSVDGRPLEAGVAPLAEDAVDSGPIVLTADAFGTLVGSEVIPITGVSELILGIQQPIVSIDLSADEQRAAVQLGDGHVYLAGGGQMNEMDARANLVEPSLDPQGYTWSVPSNDPRALTAWSSEGAEHKVLGAWPDASAVHAIRVSADGSRIAAIIDVGGQRWTVVSSIVRDENGVPIELGPIVKQLGLVDGRSSGLVWIGAERLGILSDQDGPTVTTVIVSGTGTRQAAPTAAVSIAGARSTARVLGADGTVFARSGSAWREAARDVIVLATRAGH